MASSEIQTYILQKFVFAWVWSGFLQIWLHDLGFCNNTDCRIWTLTTTLIVGLGPHLFVKVPRSCSIPSLHSCESIFWGLSLLDSYSWAAN